MPVICCVELARSPRAFSSLRASPCFSNAEVTLYVRVLVRRHAPNYHQYSSPVFGSALLARLLSIVSYEGLADLGMVIYAKLGFARLSSQCQIYIFEHG